MNEKIKDKNEASLSGSANSVSQEGDQSAEPAEKESVLRNKKLPTLLGLFLLVVTILTLSII